MKTKSIALRSLVDEMNERNFAISEPEPDAEELVNTL